MPVNRWIISLAYLFACILWRANIGILLTATVSRATVMDAAAPQNPHAMSRISEPKWKKRFDAISEQARRGDAEVVFLGDSITHGWKYAPQWRNRFGRYQALNAGISSDRVEHLLWRVRHGNLDQIKPKVAVILIGVNNLAVSTPAAITSGVQQIIREIHLRSPMTQVLLFGLFPTGKESDHPRRAKITAVNKHLAKLERRPAVEFVDIGTRFLESDGSLSQDVMPDYLHLSARGYSIWADALQPYLERAVKR